MEAKIDGIDTELQATLLSNNNNEVRIAKQEDFDEFDIRNLNVSLNWRNLSYAIRERNTLASLAKFKFREAFTSNPKVILHPQSGSVKIGTLMAVIGKSGSGKSTLLESLTGRRVKNLTGDITITIQAHFSSLYDCDRIKVAFIPQNDCLLGALTIEESLVFASKIKNSKILSNKKHSIISSDLLEQFDLIKSRNVRISACSGGEKKRLSVALELVSKPTILVVDEPTSGLDSSSALQCIQLLKKLTNSIKNPVAVIVSIHQPSAKILNEFHKIYLLSHKGQCLYNGPVDQFLPYCSHFNLSCPQFHNPADFAIEVATGEHGEEPIAEMSTKQTILSGHEFQSKQKLEEIPLLSVISSMRQHSSSAIVKQSALLTKRALITTFRDSYLMIFRLCVYLSVGLFMAVLFSKNKLEEDGCIFTKRNGDYSVYFSIEKLRHFQRSLLEILGFLLITVLFLKLAAMMIAVVTIPAEMDILFRERTNGWYSCLAYYIAKTISDVPLQLLCATVYTCISYYFTGLPNDNWRFSMFLLNLILVTLLGETIGFITGVTWPHDVKIAIFFAPISVMPFLLLSGYFVRIESIPNFLRPLSYISYFRFSFESLLLCLYGFNRCEINEFVLGRSTNESLVNTTSEMNESLNSVLFRFVNYVARLDLSYSNTRPLLYALAIDKNQSLSELHSFDTYFRDFNISNLNNLNLVQNKSMVIQEFELEDYQLHYNIYMLCSMLLVVRVIGYIVLCIKANKND